MMLQKLFVSVGKTVPMWTLALLVLMTSTLPAHAQRTVTTTGLGNGGFAVTPVDTLHTCAASNMGADACAGAFQYGEDSAAVDSIVSQYRSLVPSNVWGNRTVETSSGGAISTTGLFEYGGDLLGGIRFNQELRGSFVVALSGRWASTQIGPGLYARTPWSAYFLFDNVVAEPYSALTQLSTLFWDLSEGPAPDVVPGVLDVYGTRGLSVDRVSIYLYSAAVTGNNVPEPTTLALTGLALVVAARCSAAARRRQRKSA